MYSTRFNEAEKLWYGPDVLPLYNPSVNLAQALLNSMSIFGSKIAQVSGTNENYIENCEKIATD